MTLQTSGAISLSQVQTEFGGSNPISLSEYYAGGTYVPSGTSGANGAVPSSGTISMSKFYGTSSIVVNGVSDTTVNGIGSTSASASFGFIGGTVHISSNSSSDVDYNWITPTSYFGDYQYRVTVTSGSLSFGSGTGVWTTFAGSSVNWGVSASTSYYEVTESATIYVEIRKTSTGTVVDTATINLIANAYGIA